LVLVVRVNISVFNTFHLSTNSDSVSSSLVFDLERTIFGLNESPELSSVTMSLVFLDNLVTTSVASKELTRVNSLDSDEFRGADGGNNLELLVLSTQMVESDELSVVLLVNTSNFEGEASTSVNKSVDTTILDLSVLGVVKSEGLEQLVSLSVTVGLDDLVTGLVTSGQELARDLGLDGEETVGLGDNSPLLAGSANISSLDDVNILLEVSDGETLQGVERSNTEVFVVISLEGEGLAEGLAELGGRKGSTFSSVSSPDVEDLTSLVGVESVDTRFEGSDLSTSGNSGKSGEEELSHYLLGMI
jgi:hypothetical protein